MSTRSRLWLQVSEVETSCDVSGALPLDARRGARGWISRATQMKTEPIHSGSASLRANGREREREGRIRLRKYIHIRRSPVALGEKRYSQKSWEKRNLDESFREQSSSFVSQKDTRGHVNLVSIPISLSSSLPRNEAACLYIIRLCIGPPGHQPVPFIIIIQINVYTDSTSPILGNQAESFPQIHWSTTLSSLSTTNQSTPIRHGPWIR